MFARQEAEITMVCIYKNVSDSLYSLYKKVNPANEQPNYKAFI